MFIHVWALNFFAWYRLCILVLIVIRVIAVRRNILNNKRFISYCICNINKGYIFILGKKIIRNILMRLILILLIGLWNSTEFMRLWSKGFVANSPCLPSENWGRKVSVVYKSLYPRIENGMHRKRNELKFSSR